MTDDEILPSSPPAARTRPATWGLLLVVGLVLIIISGVILVAVQTTATNSLVHRGDCRAQFQGEFDKDLAALVREAIRPQPDPAKLDAITKGLGRDAQQYQDCKRTASSTP